MLPHSAAMLSGFLVMPDLMPSQVLFVFQLMDKRNAGGIVSFGTLQMKCTVDMPYCNSIMFLVLR